MKDPVQLKAHIDRMRHVQMQHEARLMPRPGKTQAPLDLLRKHRALFEIEAAGHVWDGDTTKAREKKALIAEIDKTLSLWS